MNENHPKWIIILLFLMGITCFFIPIVSRIIKDNEYNDYLETTGELVEYKELGKDDNGIKEYKLTYKYMVDEYVYLYEPETIVTATPKIGSKVIIKYNPNNHDSCYCNEFNGLKWVSILGMFFLLGALMFSKLSDIIWIRDILMFVFATNFIVYFIKNNLYKGGFIIVILICGTFWFASLMDFLSYIKNNKFTPVRDLKRLVRRNRKRN